MDEDDRDVEAVKEFVREAIRGVFYFGLQRSNLDELKEQFPELHDYLMKEYGDFVGGSTIAFKKKDKLSIPIPYVLLPNKERTLITWDSKNSSINFVESEDLTLAVERLK